VLNYLGMHRDITAMHRLECEVKNQKALIESVVDAAPMVIAVLDVDDRVVLDNQEYKKLQADLGMAEPAPMLMTSIRAGLEAESALAKPGRRNSGYVFLDREVRLDLPGGKPPRWFSCSGSRVREDDSRADAFFAGGGRDYLLLVAKEITGLRAEQEKGRVAALQAVMAEEDRVSVLRESLSAATFRLEGPLNMMSSVVAMLARRQGGSDPMAVALADAIASGEQALAELRAMIPAETREPSGAINVNELLRDVLDLSTRRLLASGIRVSWKPQAMLPTLQGYPNKLRSDVQGADRQCHRGHERARLARARTVRDQPRAAWRHRGGDHRQRPRHSGRTAAQGLRALLHHQARGLRTIRPPRHRPLRRAAGGRRPRRHDIHRSGTNPRLPRARAAAGEAQVMSDSTTSTLLRAHYEMLFRVSQALSRSLDFHQTLREVLRTLEITGHLSGGMVSVVDPDVGDLTVHAVHGLESEVYEPVRYQPGEGLIGMILEGGRTVAIARLGDEPRFLNRLGIYDKDLPFIAAPIQVGGALQGVLAVQPDAPDDGLLEERARFVEMVANLIGQSVRLSQEVETSARPCPRSATPCAARCARSMASTTWSGIRRRCGASSSRSAWWRNGRPRC
jgi:hypothetical protein